VKKVSGYRGIGVSANFAPSRRHAVTPSRSFADIIGSFLGKPFLRGGRGPDGYDCIGFVVAALADLGKPHAIPEAFGGWTLDTYPNLYDQNHLEAEALMIQAFRSIGKEINPHLAFAGDLIVVRHMNGHFFPAIYTGNNQAVASFLFADVRSFSLEKRLSLHMARRID
jgi:cell wall-associated NlpC family hydrolase